MQDENDSRNVDIHNADTPNADIPNVDIRDDDYDSPWKQIIQTAFPEFMAFYFPDAAAQIDWSREHEFLEQELQQILPDAELGRRVVDVLARIFLRDGSEKHIYVHVEVQSSHDTHFAERMFTCNARLHERYHRPVASFAVLADQSRTWRPERFVSTVLGCTLRLDFPVAKLNDYASRLDTLPADPNPFAVITAAHLLTQRSRKNIGQRFAFKRQLLLLVMEHHANRPRIAGILKALDWMMRLPKDINLDLWKEIKAVTNKPRKEWMTPPEIWAIEEAFAKGLAEGKAKGMSEGMAEGMAEGKAAGKAEGKAEGEVKGECTLLRKQLTLRFGPLSDEILARLAAANTVHLELWGERILDARSLDDIFQKD